MRKWLASLALVAVGISSVPVAAQQQQRVPLPQPQPQQQQQQTQQQAQQRPPNILVIMGDDVGWFNIGAYHRGIMSGKTPNLDRLASEGIRTITPKRAAPQAARTSLPGSYRSALG